ncbi:MAG: hypothetical protein WAM74_14015, partial [Xanthobacteraceae bacterium]
MADLIGGALRPDADFFYRIQNALLAYDFQPAIPAAVAPDFAGTKPRMTANTSAFTSFTHAQQALRRIYKTFSGDFLSSEATISSSVHIASAATAHRTAGYDHLPLPNISLPRNAVQRREIQAEQASR